jgi:hypothetical protein
MAIPVSTPGSTKEQMTLKNIIKTFFLATLISGILSTPVMSYSPFLDQTIEEYNVRARCELCHFGVKLNSYGQDFKKEWQIGRDVIKSIRAVENLDSDQDGFSNLAEIKAMSLPGDKTSIPQTGTPVSGKNSYQKASTFQFPENFALLKSH